jgi:hypothetical protein
VDHCGQSRPGAHINPQAEWGERSGGHSGPHRHDEVSFPWSHRSKEWNPSSWIQEGCRGSCGQPGCALDLGLSILRKGMSDANVCSEHRVHTWRGAREGLEDVFESNTSNNDINGFGTWRRMAESGDILDAELIKEVGILHSASFNFQQ